MKRYKLLKDGKEYPSDLYTIESLLVVQCILTELKPEHTWTIIPDIDEEMAEFLAAALPPFEPMQIGTAFVAVTSGLLGITLDLRTDRVGRQLIKGLGFKYRREHGAWVRKYKASVATPEYREQIEWTLRKILKLTHKEVIPAAEPITTRQQAILDAANRGKE